MKNTTQQFYEYVYNIIKKCDNEEHLIKDGKHPLL